MSPHVTKSVICGYLDQQCSRREAQRLCAIWSAAMRIDLPQPPVARYWCRKLEADDPQREHGKYIFGWTAPIPVREQNEPRLIKFPSEHDDVCRGALVT